jgi:hypothetical protein
VPRRGARLVQIKSLFDLAHGHYQIVYRGFHALLLTAAPRAARSHVGGLCGSCFRPYGADRLAYVPWNGWRSVSQ